MGPGTPYFREIQIGAILQFGQNKSSALFSSLGGPPKNNIDVSFVTFFLGSVSGYFFCEGPRL